MLVGGNLPVENRDFLQEWDDFLVDDNSDDVLDFGIDLNQEQESVKGCWNRTVEAGKAATYWTLAGIGFTASVLSATARPFTKPLSWSLGFNNLKNAVNAFNPNNLPNGKKQVVVILGDGSKITIDDETNPAYGRKASVYVKTLPARAQYAGSEVANAMVKQGTVATASGLGTGFMVGGLLSNGVISSEDVSQTAQSIISTAADYNVLSEKGASSLQRVVPYAAEKVCEIAEGGFDLTVDTVSSLWNGTVDTVSSMVPQGETLMNVVKSIPPVTTGTSVIVSGILYSAYCDFASKELPAVDQQSSVGRNINIKKTTVWRPATLTEKCRGTAKLLVAPAVIYGGYLCGMAWNSY